MELAHGDAPCLLQTDDGGIRTLTLNRPRQFNALSADLLQALEDALDDLGTNREIRVVVMAGAGRAFCAGHDLREIRAHTSPTFSRDIFERMSRIMCALTRLPQPVIASVHGMAYAAGCQLVAQCDLAVASEAATFATSGISFGIFCNTPGVALARNIPRKQAFEMLVTGEPMDAATALARGLVNRVVPADALAAETARLAASILNKPRDAIAAGKKVFYDQVDAGLGTAYGLATEAMAKGMTTAEADEGMAAFAERRPPRWP